MVPHVALSWAAQSITTCSSTILDVANTVSVEFLTISLLRSCASTSELHTTTRAAKARTPPIFCNRLWICITSVLNRAPPTYRHDRVIGLHFRKVTLVGLFHDATIYAIFLPICTQWCEGDVYSLILETAAVSSLKPDITVIRQSWFQDETIHSTYWQEEWYSTTLWHR